MKIDEKRYIRINRRDNAMDPQTTSVLHDLYNKAKTGQELVTSYYEKTGHYKTPGALGIVLRPHVQAGLLPPNHLVVELEALSKESTRLKREFVAQEKSRYRKDKHLDEMISHEMALALVGGVLNRLKTGGAEPYFDLKTGATVHCRDEVLAVVARMADAPTPSGRMGKAFKYTAEEGAKLILKTLAQGPLTLDGIEKLLECGPDRARLVLKPLTDSSAVVYRNKAYVTPDWKQTTIFAPAVVRKIPAPPAEVTDGIDRVIAAYKNGNGHAAPPPAPLPPSLTQEIYRAIRAGEITPTQGAEMLSALAKGH